MRELLLPAGGEATAAWGSAALAEAWWRLSTAACSADSHELLNALE